jgi:nucleoside 2-deoxyribosyltransferase
MKVFLICPVRNATEAQIDKIKSYIYGLEAHGTDVHYPARDTDQNDPVGYRICCDNRQAIEKCDEVHIFWDAQSKGSLFDLGMAFALKKKIVIANMDEIEPTPNKSFTNMICHWMMKGE